MQPSRSTINTLMTFFTIVLALLFLTAPAAGQDCSVETDEFSGKKSVSCDYVDATVEEQPSERLTLSRAQIISIDGEIVMMFASRSDSWNFLSTESAYALVDGERISWDLERIETKTESGSVIELHGVFLTRGELRQIGESETLRVKVGGAVYDLSNTPISSHAAWIGRNL